MEELGNHKRRLIEVNEGKWLEYLQACWTKVNAHCLVLYYSDS